MQLWIGSVFYTMSAGTNYYIVEGHVLPSYHNMSYH